MKEIFSVEAITRSKMIGIWRKTKEVLILMTVAVVLSGLPGCLSFGSGSGSKGSSNVADKAIDGEVAEMVKLYRMCLQKNEETPVKARENCGMYKDAIRDLAPDNMRTIVGEVMDKIRDKCQKSLNKEEGAS